MDDLSLGIGARVRRLRLARGMTQQQLATELSMSLIWVKKLEAGEVQADPRISLLRKLGAALGVPLGVLIDDVEAADVVTADGVRTALLSPSPQTDPRAVDLARETDYGYYAFQGGNWRAAVGMLPRLIGAARAAEGGTGDPRALRQLAEVCHLAAITLTKIGDPAGGWAAGDEAVRCAEASGDAIELALSAQSAIYAATAAERPDVGLGITHHVIDRHGTELAAAGADGTSALGMVYLKGAFAAAAADDADGAALMIQEGRRAAVRLAPDADHRRTGFNMTNVLIYEASILGDLGEYERALAVATQICPEAFAGLARERRIHHLIDTARSAQGAGRPDNALSLLLQAERDDPQNVRTWSMSRAVIAAMLSGRQPTDGRGLHGLAVRAGVAG